MKNKMRTPQFSSNSRVINGVTAVFLTRVQNLHSVSYYVAFISKLLRISTVTSWIDCGDSSNPKNVSFHRYQAFSAVFERKRSNTLYENSHVVQENTLNSKMFIRQARHGTRGRGFVENRHLHSEKHPLESSGKQERAYFQEPKSIKAEAGFVFEKPFGALVHNAFWNSWYVLPIPQCVHRSNPIRCPFKRTNTCRMSLEQPSFRTWSSFMVTKYILMTTDSYPLDL